MLWYDICFVSSSQAKAEKPFFSANHELDSLVSQPSFFFLSFFSLLSFLFMSLIDFSAVRVARGQSVVPMAGVPKLQWVNVDAMLNTVRLLGLAKTQV